MVYGLHRALVAGAQKALVADLVPAASRARGYGIYYTCVGLTLLPASVMFGLLYQKVGPWVAFGTGSVLALLGTALLPLSRVGRARRDDKVTGHGSKLPRPAPGRPVATVCLLGSLVRRSGGESADAGNPNLSSGQTGGRGGATGGRGGAAGSGA